MYTIKQDDELATQLIQHCCSDYQAFFILRVILLIISKHGPLKTLWTSSKKWKQWRTNKIHNEWFNEWFNEWRSESWPRGWSYSHHIKQAKKQKLLSQEKRPWNLTAITAKLTETFLMSSIQTNCQTHWDLLEYYHGCIIHCSAALTFVCFLHPAAKALISFSDFPIFPDQFHENPSYKKLSLCLQRLECIAKHKGFLEIHT